MISEIKRIPRKAIEIYEHHKEINLPQKIPYLGFGSAYHVLLALKYSGRKIYPEHAAEYKHYLQYRDKQPLGIIFSFDEKDEMSEDYTSLFHEYIAIVNKDSHPLSNGKNLLELFILNLPGDSSSSIAYVSSLIILYQGLNLDCLRAIDFLRKDIDFYEAKGRLLADEIQKFSESGSRDSIFILGNGPNIATARQAAMIINKNNSIAVSALSIFEFHNIYGKNVSGKLLIFINDSGPGKDYADQYIESIKMMHVSCIFIEEIDVPWALTPINLIMPFDFAAYYLSKKGKPIVHSNH